MLRVLGIGLLLTLSAGAGKAQPNGAEPPAPFRVIVNSQNPATTLTRKFVADVFLKRSTRWADGEVIKPVDLPPDSVVRVRFSERVLERNPSQVRNYWQQRIFSGRELPPLELKNEQDVVKFVHDYPTAIGYVSATANIEGVKVVQVRDE